LEFVISITLFIFLRGDCYHLVVAAAAHWTGFVEFQSIFNRLWQDMNNNSVKIPPVEAFHTSFPSYDIYLEPNEVLRSTPAVV
jgi:hypothetical protein